MPPFTMILALIGAVVFEPIRFLSGDFLLRFHERFGLFLFLLGVVSTHPA
jgi:hypothetical protein